MQSLYDTACVMAIWRGDPRLSGEMAQIVDQGASSAAATNNSKLFVVDTWGGGVNSCSSCISASISSVMKNGSLSVLSGNSIAAPPMLCVVTVIMFAAVAASQAVTLERRGACP